MSMNTHVLIRTPPKSVPAADGKTSEAEQNAPEDAAKKFQSMMSDLRGGEAESSGGDGKTDGKVLSAENDADVGANNGPVSQQTGNGVERVPFPVANLTDAIRKVSQTVMAKSEDGSAAMDPMSGDPEDAGDAAVRLSASLPGALSLGTVLAARMPNAPLQQPAAQKALAPPQQGGQMFQMTASASDLEIGDGTAKTGTSSLFAQFGIEPEHVGDGVSGQRNVRIALPEDAAGTVKVLRQETHFAPNMRLSPAQQVGEHIASVLKDLPAGAGRLQGGVTAKAEGPVLKTLDIQLTPHELGTVKVSLRMVGDNVEVTLATSKPQTAELLKQDRQMLDQMLKTTGFKADTITIQAADDRGGLTASNASNSNSSPAQGQQSTNGGAFGDHPNQGTTGNGTGGRGGHAEGRNEPVISGPEAVMEQSDEERAGIRLSDGIYL